MDKQKTYIIIGVVVVLVIVGIILLVSKKDSTSTNLTSTLKSPSQLLKAVPLEGYNNLALVDNNGNLNSIQFPKGIVVIWTGSVDQIPDGWALCDGQTINGFQTPDLRTKFLLGINKSSNNASYRTIGGTGGEENHTLTVEEMPSHTHNVDGGVITVGSPNQLSGGGGYFYKSGISLPTGGGKPHNNMPPYYTVAYIVKL